MLIPKNTYPAQTDDTDPTGYPHGKARNANSPNDGNGFPLESQWVNDLFGFFQALVGAAGITPSGNPEKADASDCLDALNAIYRRQDELGAVSFDVSGTNLALAAKFGLAARISHPDVLLSDDEVTLPIG